MQSSPSRPETPAETEASLRQNLQGELGAAQQELERSLEALRRAADAGDGAPLAQAQSQLQGLSSLRRRIELAGPLELIAIRSEVAASVAVTQAFVDKAVNAVGAGRGAETLQAASDAAGHEVGAFMHDFYDRKIFNPYLHFTSVEDEEAYRKRQADRRKAIEEESGKDTPQGNLAASRLALAQLDDAGAHGADQSPSYASTHSALTETKDRLETLLDAKAQASSREQRLAADRPDETASAAPNVDPAILAALSAAGVSSAPEGIGHGVTALAKPPAVGRISYDL